jgi:DNA-binding response OmpR family regulator
MRGGLILVVDNEAAIRDFVAEMLFLEGYAVAVAANGVEALRVTELFHPSLILLDLDMPVLNGFGFVQSLIEREISVPVILVSAETHLAKHARDVGAVRYIPKPFDLANLLAIVERHYQVA